MDGLSNHALGSRRDKIIIDLIQSRKALDTEQVRMIAFKDMRSGRRKAQERLQKLYTRQRVKRLRLEPNSPYIYYDGKKHGRVEHLISLNWIRIWIEQNIKGWETLQRWDYEFDHGILQADGFAVIKNTVTDKLRFMFVEMDRSENTFNKVVKYNDLYESENYSWWGQYADRFPPILVVTESTLRLRNIMECIGRDNRNGLQFEVYLLDFLKEAILNENHSVLSQSKG